MELDVSNFPKDKPLEILDPALLGSIAFPDRTTDSRRPTYNYGFSRRIVAALENGELKYVATLYGFPNLLKMSMRLDEGKMDNIYDWLRAFEKNPNVLYTIDSIEKNLKDAVYGHLSREKVGSSRKIMVAGAIRHRASTIVTDSGKLRNAQEKIQELYERFNGPSQQLRVVGVLKYCGEKNLDLSEEELQSDLNTDPQYTFEGRKSLS